MAKDLDIQVYAQQLLAGLGRSFGIPYSLVATNYAAARRREDVEYYLDWLRYDASVHHNLHHWRAVFARRFSRPVIDELLRDYYALGRGQWG